MSKGSKIVPVRIPAKLLGQIYTLIAQRNLKSKEEPWTTSAFVLCAIREKLDHSQRSRGRRRRSPASSSAPTTSSKGL